MEKSMKQNESKNFNILRVLQMTTTLESNKSFVVTFRRYQLNANTRYSKKPKHLHRKSVNSRNCRCKTIKIDIGWLLK